ncbi:hypothetical protein J5V16_03775 [Glycomyces sp. NEAU-S30]|uniref:Sugar ABC transporter permease n=1 Tax=Glycomyces niveus TaxID=2820287 RepID=A0ABS3U2M4_9ACTN|nr:hypothetical protein [Glycomyces sp. NEAU-S30]MBO3731927.1 hypothetical protein [Glycomyces sp. NEAU-S30]
MKGRSAPRQEVCCAGGRWSSPSAGLHLQNWHLRFAYIILMSLPLLIMFVVAPRRIASGITSGAVE